MHPSCQTLGPMNEPPILLKHSQERHYSAHNTLLHIALIELEGAKSGTVGQFNHAFIAITFSALAIEALANAVGDRVVPEWKDFENASPFAKVRLLAEKLGVPYSAAEEPWAAIRWLCKFRNQVAHAKPERVTREEVVSQHEHETRRYSAPPSKLESQVTEGNARRAVKAVEALKYALSERIPAGERFGLSSDGWSSSTKLHDVA